MHANLTIKHSDLQKTLIQFARLCEPEPQEQAVLSFDGYNLYVDLAGMSVSTPAQGSWPGQARILGRSLIALAKVPPAGDPVSIATEDDYYIRFGQTFRVPCTWQSAWSAIIQLPMNPPIAMILALPMKYSAAQIEASGLTKVVESSGQKRDQVLGSAVNMLSDFGVDQLALRRLVDECILKLDSAKHNFCS